MKCENCNASTTNPRFCSKSCSASFTNRTSPKIARTKICNFYECNELIISSRQYCDNHKWGSGMGRSANPKKLDGKTWKAHTKKELFDALGYSKAQSSIRIMARKRAKLTGVSDKCFICGYSTFVDVAHIVSVSSFSDHVTIDIINSADNLIGLCPNHHREFDAGLINLSSRP